MKQKQTNKQTKKLYINQTKDMGNTNEEIANKIKLILVVIRLFDLSQPNTLLKWHIPTFMCKPLQNFV